MKEKELENFVNWLVQSGESPKGASFEETVSWINELVTSEDGRQMLDRLIKTYKNKNMFKDGGKLKYLLCLKSGGKNPNCGCNKVIKGDEGIASISNSTTTNTSKPWTAVEKKNRYGGFSFENGAESSYGYTNVGPKGEFKDGYGHSYAGVPGLDGAVILDNGDVHAYANGRRYGPDYASLRGYGSYGGTVDKLSAEQQDALNQLRLSHAWAKDPEFMKRREQEIAERSKFPVVSESDRSILENSNKVFPISKQEKLNTNWVAPRLNKRR